MSLELAEEIDCVTILDRNDGLLVGIATTVLQATLRKALLEFGWHAKGCHVLHLDAEHVFHCFADLVLISRFSHYKSEAVTLSGYSLTLLGNDRL